MDQRRQDVQRSVPVTFGTSQIVLCRDGLTVSTVTLNGGRKFGSHAHAHDQLCVVLEGCYEQNCDARAYALRAGSVLWRRAGKMHANVIGADDVEVILVDIEPERSKKLCSYLASPAAYFAPGAFDDLRRELLFELHRSDQASRVAIEGLVCLLAARTGRRGTLPNSAMPKWLSKAVEMIRSEYGCGISLAAVATAAGVHPVTVAVAFRRHLREVCWRLHRGSGRLTPGGSSRTRTAQLLKSLRKLASMMNRTWGECSAVGLAFLPAPFDPVRFNNDDTKGIPFSTAFALSEGSGIAYISSEHISPGG
jgi:quercetin dioxygenase-like cupin family protein